MSIWLQLVVMGIYFYVAGEFFYRKEWPWALIYLCYAVSMIGIIWAQPKG